MTICVSVYNIGGYLERFFDCLNDDNVREENYRLIARQSSFVNDFIKLSKNG